MGSTTRASSAVCSNASERLTVAGLPMHNDPFTQPKVYVAASASTKITDERHEREELLEKIMSGDDAA